jgi:hypothetical protein
VKPTCSVPRRPGIPFEDRTVDWDDKVTLLFLASWWSVRMAVIS